MAVKKDPRMAAPLDSTGPGAYLREAREEANMTVERVATVLLLQTAIVEALEADAYDRLPAPTFVRGYLRGYARVLGLPSRPVLEMYNRQGFESPPLTSDVTESKQAHTSDAVVRLATFAVAAVLVLLVGLWWNSQEDGGFGISGDLFDWSADSDQDPTATDETGAGSVDGEAGDESIAMETDGLEGLHQGGDFVPPSPGDDTVPSDLDTAGTTPDDSGAESGSGETAPLEPGGSSRDEEVPGTTPAADAATGDTASAQAAQGDATADGASDARAPLQPDESSRDEGSAVTSPIEDVPTGSIVTVESAPTDATVSGGTGDRETPATQETGSRAAAEGDVNAGADAEDAADADDTAGTEDAAGAEDEAGVERTEGGGEAPAPEGSDGTGGGDETAGASLPAASESEAAGTTADTGAGETTESETATSGLVLEFEHESWVEVYDSERSRLFFGLVQSGRVLSFDGPQPFDVLLGFGKDVRVVIDGKAFDHTPYLKHGVGRFSVGTGVDAGAGTGASTGAAAPDAVFPERSSPPQDDRG